MREVVKLKSSINKKFMRFNKIFLLTIFVAIGTIFSFQTNAQTGGLTISPLTFELTAKPGEVLISTVKVYNPSDNVISIKMIVEDFQATGESGQIVVEPGEDTTYSLKKWVKIEPTEFTLKSKEQKFVTFTISVPGNAEPGGRYGSIFASITTMIGEKPTNTNFTQKVGSLIILTVSGEAKESLVLKEFSVSESSGLASFKIRFENNGTVHLGFKGLIVIENCQGEKIEDLEVPVTNILPGATRETDVSWKIKSKGNCYNAYLMGAYGLGNIPFSSEKINFQTSSSVSPESYKGSGTLWILILIFRFLSLWKF
jgi:hypothetical protein